MIKQNNRNIINLILIINYFPIVYSEKFKFYYILLKNKN